VLRRLNHHQIPKIKNGKGSWQQPDFSRPIIAGVQLTKVRIMSSDDPNLMCKMFMMFNPDLGTLDSYGFVLCNREIHFHSVSRFR